MSSLDIAARPPIRAEETVRIALLLAFTGGFLDAYTWILHGVMANAQTANLVLLWVHSTAGEWEQALNFVPPMAAFAVGIVIAAWMRRATDRAGIIGTLIEILMLVAIGIFHIRLPNLAGTLGISLVAAMQTTIFSKVNGVTYNSVMITGNLRQAIEFAALASIFLLLGRASQPNIAFLGRLPGTGRYSDSARHEGVEPLVGVIAFRPDASLLYINAEMIMETVLKALRKSQEIRLVACDLSASPYIDLAGARMLVDLHDELASRRVTFGIVGAHAQLRDLLRAEGLAEKIDSAEWLGTLDSVLEKDRAESDPNGSPQKARP